jgi:F0F1-type ATP synthase assembly protein I
LKRNIKLISGAIGGAAVGWLIYRFIGCSTGACPITANPYVSMLFCGTAGLLIMLTDSAGKENQQREQEKENHDHDE